MAVARRLPDPALAAVFLRRVMHAPGEPGEQRQDLLAGEVQVVEPHHHRGPGGVGHQQPREQVHRALFDSPRIRVHAGDVRRLRVGHAHEVPDEVRRLHAQDLVAEDLRHARPQLGAAGLRVILGRDVEAVAEDLQEHGVGRALGAAGGGQDGDRRHVLVEALHELLDEPRLADAPVPEHEHRAPTAVVDGVSEGLPQPVQLLDAPHEDCGLAVEVPLRLRRGRARHRLEFLIPPLALSRAPEPRVAAKLLVAHPGGCER